MRIILLPIMVAVPFSAHAGQEPPPGMVLPHGWPALLLLSIVAALVCGGMLLFVLRRRLPKRDDGRRDDCQCDVLQHIIDAVPAPLFYKDVNGRYLGCNRAFEAVLGKHREEIIGRTVYDVAPSDLAAVYHQADLELMTQQREQIYETQVLFADGQRRDIMFHKAVFLNDDGKPGGMVGTMLDLSDLKRSERDCVASEERYRAFITMSSEGIWRGDVEPPVDISLPAAGQINAFIENIRVGECNDALARIYGFERAEELIGRRTREFYDQKQVQEVLEVFVANGYNLSNYETRQFDRQGREIWLASSLVGIVEQGKIARIWGTRRNITESRRYLEELEYLANHDPLTGIPNRFSLKRRLEEVLASATEERGQLALFIMDLDRFKEVNDTLGHHAGDLLLVEIAIRLNKVLSGLGGEIARLGGDEFAVIYTRIRNERDVLWLAELMLRTMQSPYDIEGIKVEVEASLGISLAPAHGMTPSSLLRCADVAMYRAKKEMKRYCIYDRAQDPYTPERLVLMTDLWDAIRQDQLMLHFQPKMRLGDGGLAGFEALVRWHHPTQGLLLPAEFIPFAEIGELIVPLTYQVLEKALQQLKKWLDTGLKTTVACNLSTRLLMDEDLPYHIEAFLGRYQVDPACLELEITETALIAEPERARDILNRIHAMGIRLSIDDFGTGYSSLALLKSLPLQALKIDLLFVSQMLGSEQDAIIVSSTVNLAHNLGLSVVAEGVENAETLAALAAMGCDQAQGYHVGMPMAEAELAHYLELKGWGGNAPGSPGA